MAISYIAVTLVIVLLLEALVTIVLYFVFTRSPIIAYFTLARAGHTAQIYALQAAVQAGDEELSLAFSFDPGQTDSLALRQEGDPPEMTYMNLDVPYLAPGSAAPPRPVFALLIGPDERILASSYPDRYPVATNAAQALPEEIALVRKALAGTSDGMVEETSQGRRASVARTVWSREKQPLGAVLVQSPAGGTPEVPLLSQVASVLIPSGLAWLCLMLPIGLTFGYLATRGMIRRIERLALATQRFTQGDYSQRVPVSRPDEIGQLEQQFNQMAGQLVDSFAQRQADAEQSARREERARIEQEMSSANYIQQSLLPESVPAIPGWRIEPFYRPAREVGGDLYDFLHLPSGQLGIVIGDVTGKGMPAALIMATTTAMLRAAAPGAASPGEVLALVNDLLRIHIPSGVFATCFYAILNPASGRLRYANAGHTLPCLVRDSQVLELRATGMPLGLMPGQDYAEQELTLAAHDRLLFYTDGLVEAHSPDNAMFGVPRLKRLLQGHPQPDGLLQRLLHELEAFTGQDWEQEDDVTLISVQGVSHGVRKT